MTKAIVYARVSTDDQADKGFSLSAQVEAGRKYAEAHAMTVSQELIDDGVSGAMAFSERPAGAVAWALLRSGKADALIVQNVDRLSRDVVDLLVTIRALLRAGVGVHCLDLGRVTSEYDIMLVIRGWQGSDERDKIRKRSMRGRREKLSQGLIAAGRTPYGYDHLRDGGGRAVNFEINQEQADVVRLIFQWYTEGDGDGSSGGPYSLYEIAARLNAAGIPTNIGRAWAGSTISRMIDNTVYKGEWRYNASATDDAPERVFTIAVPAIVDPATWDAAQAQKARNRRKAKRNGKHDYLLTGIIQCGCGYGMHGHAYVKRGKTFLYYTCNSEILYRKADRQCEEKSIRADHLDTAAWLAFRDRLEHSDTLEADMREMQRREDAEREPKTTELDAVLAMMREAEAEAGTLAETLQALTEKQRKGIVGKSLQDKVDAVNERYDNLTARRDKLEAELSHRRVTEEAIAEMVSYTEGVRKGLDNATAAEKRTMLDQFNARVTVTDGKPVLSLQMPREIIIDLHLHLQTQPNYTLLEIDLVPYLAIVSQPTPRASAAIPTATATA